MSIIKARCYDCGDVELSEAQMCVLICLDDGRGQYRFTCPACSKIVLKSAEERTIELLIATGVKRETWLLPAEVFERKSGPAISHDNLLDFHQDLVGDDADQLNALWAELGVDSAGAD